MIFRSSLFIFVAVAGISQQKPAATIEGLVLDAQTGAPVKGAQIWLDRLKVMEAGALTGSDGRFVLDNVVPGRYGLAAHHSRYLRQNYGAKRAGGRGTPLIIAPGQRPKNIEIRLWRSALVTGRIVDEEGKH